MLERPSKSNIEGPSKPGRRGFIRTFVAGGAAAAFYINSFNKDDKPVANEPAITKPFAQEELPPVEPIAPEPEVIEEPPEMISVDNYINQEGVEFKFPKTEMDKKKFLELCKYFERSEHEPGILSNLKNKVRIDQGSELTCERDEIYYLVWNTYREARHVAHDTSLSVKLRKLGNTIAAENKRLEETVGKEDRSAILKNLLNLEKERLSINGDISNQNEGRREIIDSERLAIMLCVLDRSLSGKKRYQTSIPEIVLQPEQFSWTNRNGGKFPSPYLEKPKPGEPIPKERINLIALQQTIELIESLFIPGMPFEEIRYRLRNTIAALLKVKVSSLPEEFFYYERSDMTGIDGAINEDLLNRANEETKERLTQNFKDMQRGLLPYLIVGEHIFYGNKKGTTN